MNPLVDQIAVVAAIGGALGFFIARWWRGRKSKSGCGGGCCTAKKPLGPKPL